MGSEIRELRKARCLTLQKLSERTGVSLSYLSEIERGVTNPSIEAMEAMAKALQVDVSWFFPSRHGRGPMERAHVVRANARRSLNSVYGRTLDEIGYSDSLISSTIGGSLYMGIARFEPGKSGSRQVHPINDPGEHHGLVIEGELELTMKDEVMLLGPGDSYSLENSIPHRVRNMSDRPCVLVWAASPVILNIFANEPEKA